jgi:DHA2 family multidrug resistance protein
MIVFLPQARRRSEARLDWIGFASLSIAIAALQVMLDRGQELDWLGSKEIVAELIVAAAAFYVFLVHTFTAREPFLRPALFRDRNFTAGVIFVAIVGLTFYASLALQPPYLQDLMNYPVITAGFVMGPRGIGTMAAMMIVGKLMNRTDTRLLLGVGLGLSAWSFYLMTGWTPDVSSWAVVWVGVIQGVGLGFLFTPLSVVSLSTLPQPGAQRRLQHRHFHRRCAVGSRHAGQPCGHRPVRHRGQPPVRQPGRRTDAEPPDRLRARGARRADHSAGAGDRLRR